MVNLNQAAGVRGHGGFAQLHRIHFAQPFEALDTLGALLFFFASMWADSRSFFSARPGRSRFPCHVDAEQRRHGHVDMAGFHQRGEMLQKQRAEQGGDVQAVRIGVGQDADLAVAQAVECWDPGSTPMATDMSWISLEPNIWVESTSQVLRILPRRGITAWVWRSRACLADPPAESPSTRNSSLSLRGPG
jgi:hypothetical protein